MANNRNPFWENQYYHVYNRGYEKKTLFWNKWDFERFYIIMTKYLKEFPEVKIISYAILPNHFHFILRQNKTGLEISKFMHKVQVSYAMYLKTTIKTGLKRWEPIFEWRFKAKLIDSEEYLYQCIAYVNYNPVKHELVSDIEDYPYTSYHTLIDKEKFRHVSVPELDELEI